MPENRQGARQVPACKCRGFVHGSGPPRQKRIQDPGEICQMHRSLVSGLHTCTPGLFFRPGQRDELVPPGVRTLIRA